MWVEILGPDWNFLPLAGARRWSSSSGWGGVPFAGPRHPAAAGHLHPGTSRPSRALGRLRGGGAPCRSAPRCPPPRHARHGSGHALCHPRAPCPGSALRVPALGPIRRPRPHRCLAPRADLAAPRTPLSVAQVSRATAHHSPAPGAPAARARPIGSARRARRSRCTVNRALPARSPAARRDPARSPPVCLAGAVRSPLAAARRSAGGAARVRAKQLSPLSSQSAPQAALPIKPVFCSQPSRSGVKCPGLHLGNPNGVRLPWAKTAAVVPSRACSLTLHSDCPLDRPLHFTSFWHPEIQVTLASKLSPGLSSGLSYNGH